MQRLEVSCAVRLIYKSLSVKELNNITPLSVSEDFILSFVAPKLQFTVILYSPPFICTLRQMIPVHILQLYYFMTLFNISLLSTSRSSKWSLSFTFTHQNPLRNFSLPNLRNIHCHSIVNTNTCTTSTSQVKIY